MAIKRIRGIYLVVLWTLALGGCDTGRLDQYSNIPAPPQRHASNDAATASLKKCLVDIAHLGARDHQGPAVTGRSVALHL